VRARRRALDRFLKAMLDSDAFAEARWAREGMVLVLALTESPIQLVPDGTMLIHLFGIILMVAILNATLLKPINRILEERDRRTKGRLSEAELTLRMGAQKLVEYERRLRAARADGYMLMESERSVLSREREEAVAAVKGEIAAWVTSEKEQLKIDKQQVRESLRLNAGRIALEISRQILRRDIATPGR
jgi:F-type H+-transporting ATPase subunit b